MKLFFLKTYGIFYRVFLFIKRFPVEIFNILKNFISTYFEVLRTGGIKSKATGEKVAIKYQANISGDILIFIEPLLPGVFTYDEMMNMVISDNKLIQQKLNAIHSLQQKFQGLMILPKMLAGFISVVLSLLMYLNAANIYALFNNKIEFVAIQKIFPLILLLLSVIFGKSIGFKVISIIAWLVKITRSSWLRIKSLFTSTKSINK